MAANGRITRYEPNQRFVYRFLDFYFNLKKVAKGESHQRSLWDGSGLAELSGSQGLAWPLSWRSEPATQSLIPIDLLEGASDSWSFLSMARLTNLKSKFEMLDTRPRSVSWLHERSRAPWAQHTQSDPAFERMRRPLLIEAFPMKLTHR